MGFPILVRCNVAFLYWTSPQLLEFSIISMHDVGKSQQEVHCRNVTTYFRNLETFASVVLLILTVLNLSKWQEISVEISRLSKSVLLSQMTSNSTIYSTACARWQQQQQKHQSTALLAICAGIYIRYIEIPGLWGQYTVTGANLGMLTAQQSVSQHGQKPC